MRFDDASQRCALAFKGRAALIGLVGTINGQRFCLLQFAGHGMFSLIDLRGPLNVLSEINKRTYLEGIVHCQHLLYALSSLGAFYDFDERNKTPFKGTERAINQRVALQTVMRYTDGLESFITLLMTLVLLAVFYLWRSQPCHLYPLFPHHNAFTVKCTDINLLQLMMTVEGNQGPLSCSLVCLLWAIGLSDGEDCDIHFFFLPYMECKWTDSSGCAFLLFI